MLRGSLRRYDVQAGYACVLSLASVPPLALAAIATWRRFDPNLGQIVYGSVGYFVPALLVSVLVSMLCCTIGCLLGWNSAGKRRNDKPSCSWIGFLVGGGVLTCNLILLIAFYMLGLKTPVSSMSP